MSRWEDLPRDVLQIIEERLIMLVDKVRISCVCKSWRSLLPKLPFHNQHGEAQFPLLLGQISCDKSNQASHGLFDLQQKKVYCLDLHNIKHLFIIGTSHGWLLLSDINFPSLTALNPITKAEIQLPPTPRTNFAHFEGVPVNLRDYERVHKIILSSSPSLSDNYLAVCIYGYAAWRRLAYCQKGHVKWSELGEPNYYEDIVFHKGKLYALLREGRLLVIDHNIGQVTEVTSPCSVLKSCRIFLVESCTGVLMVKEEVRSGRTRIMSRTFEFKVFKLDVGCFQWCKVTDLGDERLFLRRNSDFSVSSSPNINGMKGNIYLVDTIDGYMVTVYDKEMKIIKKLRACGKCNKDKCPSKCPIWVTPTL